MWVSQKKLNQYWTGKRVLITGASSGLGFAITKALAPYRIRFCLLSRRLAPMEQLCRDLRGLPSSFFVRSCDVQKRIEVESAVNDFCAEAGGLDVAWINSGISGETSFRKWDWDFVEQTIDTNLKGAIYTTQACLRHMVPQKRGTIVGISSAAAMRGLGGRAAYSLSKIALAYYLESLAVELSYIQFTTIYPGFVDTPINQSTKNRFWLLHADEAAEMMMKAVAKRKIEYIFPWKMNLLFRTIRNLPNFLYRPLAHKLLSVSRPDTE